MNVNSPNSGRRLFHESTTEIALAKYTKGWKLPTIN